MANTLRAQTPANHIADSAAGYAMGQNNALKSYYGALLENPNVRAGLATIRATEGTATKANPYATAFGGGTLANITDHPGISYGFKETTGKKNRTTAAGAYQFLSGTWKSMAKKLGLKDFGPLNQDIAALGLIDQAGALADLVSGNVKGFVSKVNGVWASLPGAPYAQPTKSWGFVEDAWNNALNPTAPMPGTAPTPYSRDDPQSFADARPDNQNYSGPKGLFSVDTSVAAPIGHVARAPLGPVSTSFGPSTPKGFSAPKGYSLGAPAISSQASAKAAKGVASAAAAVSKAASVAKSAPSVGFSSQDEKTNTGSVANAPSPARPDTLGGLNYGAPKGVFSVDPAAAISGVSIAPTPGTPAPSATTLGPVAPAIAAAVPAKPSIAPVAAAAVPEVVAPTVARVAPAVPSYSPSQAVAPARPALSAADVYGGSIGTAQTSTPGTTVSRATSYGPTYTTNKYGAVTATAPDGTQMAAWGGVPAPQISGPLDNTGIATPSTGVSGMFGPKAKAATGTLAGAAIGGYALGPLGAVLGGLIGKNVAAGQAPLAGLFGGSTNNANTHVVDTFDGPMRAYNAVGGMGFPSAPSAPAGGLTSATGSNRSAAGMRGISPGAASAIGKGQGGLY